MIVAFANNQLMVAKGNGSQGGAATVITTDPVPMNGFDRASAILNVEMYLDAGSQGPTFEAQAQVSNDGVNWVNDGPAISGVNSVGTQPIDTKLAEGQSIRFQFTWNPETGAAGTDYVFICFDLHVRLDHS